MKAVEDENGLDSGQGQRWPGRFRAGLAVSAVALLAVFSYLAAVVDNFPGEVATSEWVQSWRASWLDAVMEFLSALGQEVAAVVIVLSTAVALYLRGLRGYAGLIVAVSVGGYVIRTALKLAIDRPRPSPELVEVIEQADGSSFPSGHVMFFTVFLGMLAFMLLSNVKPGVTRWLGLGAMATLMALVGLSRIYLGVHWLGDVLAGYAFSAIVVAGAVWARRAWSQATSS